MTNISLGYYSLTNDVEYEMLFEVILRPLKSKNARVMYAIFTESYVDYLTTLDIQNRLYEFEVNLSKKEINGWLRSLQDAGLIERGDDRGKPTTLEYHDKYTFDMWRLTSLGKEISHGITAFLLRKNPYREASFPIFDEILGVDPKHRKQLINRIENTHLKTGILIELLHTGNELGIEQIKERTLSSEVTIDEVISELTASGLLMQGVKSPSDGLIARLKEFLGFTVDHYAFISLTERGRNIAEELYSVFQ